MSIKGDLPNNLYLKLMADDLRLKPWQEVNQRLAFLSEKAKNEKRIFQVIVSLPSDMPEVIYHLITSYADEVIGRNIIGVDVPLKKRGEL